MRCEGRIEDAQNSQQMRTKPLLLVDIDGVISLFGAFGRTASAGQARSIDRRHPPLSFVHRRRAPARLCPTLRAGLVQRLGGEGRRVPPHLLGLPAACPSCASTAEAPGAPHAHWKLDAIDAYAGDRPLAWIDDALQRRLPRLGGRAPGARRCSCTPTRRRAHRRARPRARGWARERCGQAAPRPRRRRRPGAAGAPRRALPPQCCLAAPARVLGNVELGELLGEAGVAAAGADVLQRREVLVERRRRSRPGRRRRRARARPRSRPGRAGRRRPSRGAAARTARSRSGGSASGPWRPGSACR